MKAILRGTPKLLATITSVVLVVAGCQNPETITPTEIAETIASLAKGGPIVPDTLKVPEGNRVFARVYARGVQIYQCTQTATGYAWTLTGPDATLYENERFRGQVGTHFAGPTWESNSGSRVVGMVLRRSDSPRPDAIQWLLLQKVSTSGHGLFERTTYIHRVNTTGGKAPVTGADAEHLGQTVQIPYTAEYYFYRKKH